jgi:hypothetical protein
MPNNRDARGSSGLINGIRILEETYGVERVLTALIGILFERNQPETARHLDRALRTLPGRELPPRKNAARGETDT